MIHERPWSVRESISPLGWFQILANHALPPIFYDNMRFVLGDKIVFDGETLVTIVRTPNEAEHLAVQAIAEKCYWYKDDPGGCYAYVCRVSNWLPDMTEESFRQIELIVDLAVPDTIKSPLIAAPLTGN